jgi:hypothetical protein
MRIAPATVPEREARKIAAEYLRPQNQGLELIGSATNFSEYVENTYKPLLMPLIAKTTQKRTRGVSDQYCGTRIVPAAHESLAHHRSRRGDLSPGARHALTIVNRA